jgi:hypothetical protein
MQHFLAITTGRYKAIIALTVITTALSVAFGMHFNKTSFATTAFLTLGAKQSVVLSPLDTAQAADHFSELVQGWFKNPAMLNKIETQSGSKPDLNARKQEKQNLVITYKTATEEAAKKVSQAMEQVLKDEITNYNLQNNSEFTLTSFGAVTKENPMPLILFILAGLIGGFGVGFAYGSAADKIKSELRQFAHRKK